MNDYWRVFLCNVTPWLADTDYYQMGGHPQDSDQFILQSAVLFSVG